MQNTVTNSDSVEAKIRARLGKLEATVLEIEDDSHAHRGHTGAKERGGGHFEIKIVS
jgi:BolA family transcriptional regulator, general stress-responsive regulator